ncbi:beta-lactamase family protein [Parvularcula sp. ZS-1/3]|uniref:Beta-lactamase family protein n=1 Tax=Parvularcula mediterranea TaxID=2732508 RepID=A0A7Y3RK29_9PROT|nr:serine hydrolase domain-containing protein [Parvularcula mediterranea]NNU15508.1 beta-lactamase family protein [Parvularcula mediterranea]
MKPILPLAALALAACAEPETSPSEMPPETALAQRITALHDENGDVPGFAFAIIEAGGGMISGASGVADPEGAPMTPATPLRMASITKTIVAAAVLRLMEEGEIDLDSPIGPLVGEDVLALLSGDGYDLGAITVRHLLMHSGGFADHAQTEAYLDQVFSERSKVWSPEEQIGVLVAETDPLSAPGEAFAYSDSGYVLLGLIIEGLTGRPLHEAVRELTKLDALGLERTWWDGEEPQPEGALPRAHQYVNGAPTHDIHGSIDAHGGGGLIASVEEVALFYASLFKGEVFEDPSTLDLMITAPGHPEGSPYRIGLFTGEIDGVRIYSHGGFWGTYVSIRPDSGRVVSGAALDQSGYGPMRGLLRELLIDGL